jgi:lipoprotein-releasing system permease protein
MFETSIALKYLIPRFKNLSLSIISIISTLVITTVVWLTIVFFSATEGLEKRWTEKLITITAPARILPTAEYYKSYYYLIDSMSEASNFTSKSFAQKLSSEKTDPYNPEQDSALPAHFPKAIDKDLVKEAYSAVTSLPGVTATPFETVFATTTLQITREDPNTHELTTRILTQPSYLTNLYPRQDLQPILLSPELCLPLTSDKALLPKSFREAGVRIGDTGNFAYYTTSATSLQEQQIPFTVAGFYDPGIIPIGGKLILVNQEIINRIQSATESEDQILPSGFNVHFEVYKQARTVKQAIEAQFQNRGIDAYFTVQTYDSYDFTKDIFQQLKSERNLFSLIAIIIIIVACSNIISMLIILVRDKRKELAILRALGATKTSISTIFGICGFLMGSLGSVVGALLAYITVKNLPTLLALLGALQGFDVLNAAFYGEMMPTDISQYACILVMFSTALLSTSAGIIAAFKASRQNTSEALRSE